MGTAGLEGVGSPSNPKSWSWARRYSRRYAEGSVAKSWLPYPGAESSGVRITHYRWAGKGRWRARRDRPLLPATRSIAGTCSASQWDSPLRRRRRFSTTLYQACAGKRVFPGRGECAPRIERPASVSSEPRRGSEETGSDRRKNSDVEPTEAGAAHMGRGMRCKYRGFLSGAGEACQIELSGGSQTAIPRATALSPPVLPINCWYPFLVVVNGVVPTYNSMLSFRSHVNSIGAPGNVRRTPGA